MFFQLAITFGILFGATSEVLAVSGARTDMVLLKTVANLKSWQNILHYRNDESLIDSGTYFFSKDGKYNPLSELSATLQSFSEAAANKQAFGVDSRCSFPFRFKFLKKYFDLADPVTCPQLFEWLKDKNAEKTVLVFASEYANNPASMMGHTFIRLQRKNQIIRGKHVSFLDTTFDFAAQIPDGVGSIDYTVKGLTGGFDAVFSHDTFENQIERYNNMESRDIWEYELTLSEEQSQNLTLHLYELINNARWEYFFFDENCSYHLLKAIEAVVSDHDLTGTFNSWVIPIDTIKVLINAGLVQSWSYRPSLHSRTKRSYEILNPVQKSILHESIKSNKATTNDVAVLDTAILYMNYNKHSAQGVVEEHAAELTKDLLRKRAQSGVTNLTFPTSTPYPPHNKPGTFRYGLGFERSQSSAWLIASLRPAVHEYLSGTDPSGSDHEVVFLAPSLSYSLSEMYLDLDHMVLISTANFRQTNPIGFSPAWRILADIESPFDSRVCRYCKSVRFLPAIGTAAAVLDGKLQSTLLATLHAEYGAGFLKNHRLGSGILLQMVYHAEVLKIMTKVERWWDYRGTSIQLAELHLTIPTSKDQEIWLRADHDSTETKSFGLTYSLYR